MLSAYAQQLQNHPTLPYPIPHSATLQPIGVPISSAGIGGKRTWLPTQFTKLALWLDAADTSTIVGTSPIGKWLDKSPNPKTVTFEGTNNTYNPATKSVNTDYATTSYFYADVDLRQSTETYATVFLVYTWLDFGAGTNQPLWGQDIGGGWNRFQLLSFPTTPSIEYGLSYSPNVPRVTLAPILNTPDKLLYSATYASMVPNGTYVTVNGTVASSIVTEELASPETTTRNTYFGTIDTGYAGSIGFHEILIYITPLTVNDRQHVEGYLAWKWSLQGALPANHPFKFYPPPP